MVGRRSLEPEVGVRVPGPQLFGLGRRAAPRCDPPRARLVRRPRTEARRDAELLDEERPRRRRETPADEVALMDVGEHADHEQDDRDHQEQPAKTDHPPPPSLADDDRIRGSLWISYVRSSAARATAEYACSGNANVELQLISQSTYLPSGPRRKSASQIT